MHPDSETVNTFLLEGGVKSTFTGCKRKEEKWYMNIIFTDEDLSTDGVKEWIVSDESESWVVLDQSNRTWRSDLDEWF